MAVLIKSYTVVGFIYHTPVYYHEATHNDMRPKIADSLEEKLEEEDSTGTPLYKVAGYTTKSAFVAQAVKEKIDEEKENVGWENGR